MLPPQSDTHSVFFISDGTGITAQTFGNSILAQFDLKAVRQRLPYINDVPKAAEALQRIQAVSHGHGGKRPIIFTTLVDAEVLAVIRSSGALVLDLFSTFVEPLERELGQRSSHRVGRFGDVAQSAGYLERIEAINFSLAHDDGQSVRELARADVILVGVSRCGKTPTSLYLAMQHGIRAANYPLIPEDFERNALPQVLRPYRDKLFGLTIAPERLAAIRHERRPDSQYAALENCRAEVLQAESLMRREGIATLSSTSKSIEEIATTILQRIHPDRLGY